MNITILIIPSKRLVKRCVPVTADTYGISEPIFSAPFVRNVGKIINSAILNTSDIAIDTYITISFILSPNLSSSHLSNLLSVSSSSPSISTNSALYISAFMPITRLSIKLTQPLTIGRRKNLLLVFVPFSSTLRSISPSGFLTATAVL